MKRAPRVKTTSIVGGKASLGIREDGVIHLVWQPGSSLDVDDVKSAMAEVNKISKGLAMPLLVEMADVKTVSHHARAAFSTPTAASRIALLGAGPVDWMIANFRSAHSYPCPTRFFTRRTEALDWILASAPLPEH